MLFLCVLTAVVLLLGWFLNNGDPAWGRLVVSGRSFPLQALHLGSRSASCGGAAADLWAPAAWSWCCARSSRPGSAPCWRRRWSAMASPSVWGFCFMAWVCGCWNAGCVSDQSLGMRRSNLGVLQWCSTACLWSSWLVQDLANIFVFVPRRLDGLTMASCTLVICLGLCLLVARGVGLSTRFSSPRATPLICSSHAD